MNLTDVARETLGTPFRHQGRICGVALDCVGVIAYILDRLELDYQDYLNYTRIPYKGLIKKKIDEQPCLEPVSDLTEANVLLMRFKREPQHAAFFTGSTIIHSYESIGRVVEHDLTEEWKRRIVAMYKIVGAQ
jgi:hypothetical protein